jgi:adenylosuccinate lyase
MIPRYQSKLMKEIWSDENKYAVWFLVERKYLAAYMAAQDTPDDALLERLDQANDRIDWSQFATRVARYDEEVKHDVIAFLHALEDELKEDARLIHNGLTSSDVVDTGFAYNLKAAHAAIETKLKSVIKALWLQAQEHKKTICLGRTHGQAAEPTTLGIKLLSHLCEFARGYERLKLAAYEIAIGKFSGATGVYALTSPSIENAALKSLGLLAETVSTQVVARDRHANYFSALAVLGGSVERFATEIRLLMHGQIKEVFEPFSAQQKGSSTMPHKRNPILSENLCGLMRMMRSYALAAMENQALWHERDISHSSVERIIAPDATSLMEFALSRLAGLVENLVVDKDRLRKNLVEAGHELKSQALLSALIDKGMLRQKAYELVQAAAQKGEGNFKQRLISVGITKFIDEQECDRILCENASPAFLDEIFERASNVYGSIIAG